MEALRKAVGLRIRKLREALGRPGGDSSKIRRRAHMTIAELAELAEISPAYISKLEKGKVNPTLETLGKIAKALNTPLAELFRDVDAVDSD